MPLTLRNRCLATKKNEHVLEMSVDPVCYNHRFNQLSIGFDSINIISIEGAPINMISIDLDPMNVLSVEGTLYEYVLTINPESKEDRPEILFIPKKAVQDPPAKQITHFLKESYSLRTLFMTAPGDPEQGFCKDELNRDYTPVKLMNKCVFIQIEKSKGNVSNSVKMLPTDPRQITEHLEPYREPRHGYLNQALDFLFPKVSKKKNSKLPDDGCVNLMRLSPKLATRIIICRFDPSDVEKYRNLNDEIYFCGLYSLTSSYNLYFNKDLKPEKTTKEFYNLIEHQNVKFTDMCYSEVTIEPDANSINKDFVHMNLFVKTSPIGDTNHQISNANQGELAANAAIREKLIERCPYDPRVVTKPQSYTFHMASPSNSYFIHFAFGSKVLATVRKFKPCYFQFDIGEENSFKHCVRYLPLRFKRNAITGGFQQSTELVISEESNACRVSLVQAHQKCTAFSLNQPHLALICECYSQYCDTPNPTVRKQMISSIRPKVCAVRLTPSDDDHYDTQSSIDHIACFYQITLLDGRPQFTLGAYDIKEEDGLSFQNCVNSTIPDKQRCIIKDSRQLCCCKAGTDNIPCNSVEVARNRHATSKLRASARCSTYLHLDGEDKAACNALSSKMRICVSVYDVIKNEDQTELHLARETCESEHLYSVYDLALIKCHAYRKTIVEEQSGECATILIEEYRNMTVSEAAQKVVSCCPPEAYTTARDNLKEFKFKPISEFI
uniref:Cilia- and flagella-associated protein 221 n=1 Tax=Panagrellus redivivus TaxID=6233 RepID=A0A7E4UV19_PANRE